MKHFFICSLIFFSCTLLSGCNAQNCELTGKWSINNGRINMNYELAPKYSNNKITFYVDSIELASGFFYNTLNWENDEYPVGRYPFVYYGNTESYKILNDSLYIHSKPYKIWNSFKISCFSKDRIILIGKRDTVHLERIDKKYMDNNYSIRYISVDVINDGDLSLFKVNYKAKYSSDDMLIYEELDSERNVILQKSFKLRTGTFTDICKGFLDIDIFNLKSVYPTEFSEKATTKLEIGLDDGSTIMSDIQNNACPDVLRIALVPILYGHHQFLYSNLTPVK